MGVDFIPRSLQEKYYRVIHIHSFIFSEISSIFILITSSVESNLGYQMHFHVRIKFNILHPRDPPSTLMK